MGEEEEADWGTFPGCAFITQTLREMVIERTVPGRCLVPRDTRERPRRHLRKRQVPLLTGRDLVTVLAPLFSLVDAMRIEIKLTLGNVRDLTLKIWCARIMSRFWNAFVGNRIVSGLLVVQFWTPCWGMGYGLLNDAWVTLSWLHLSYSSDERISDGSLTKIIHCFPLCTMCLASVWLVITTLFLKTFATPPPHLVLALSNWTHWIQLENYWIMNNLLIVESHLA